jgi:Zn-dependent protease
MPRSWKLGNAFGIPIYVHPTFLLLPLLVLLTTGTSEPLYLAYALALLFAVFGCVVLHELGHALMARHFGIPTRDITLTPIGGIARLERISEKPSEELLIALAGPAVNVVIFALLTPVFAFRLVAGILQPEALWLDEGLVGLALGFFTSLWLANLILVLFNLLPTFPMDGGRVVRAILNVWIGFRRATEVAVVISRVFALLLLAAILAFAPGILTHNPMLLIVFAFVYLAGQRELLMVRHRDRLRQRQAEARVFDEFAKGPFPVPPTGFTGFRWDAALQRWVRWQNGQPDPIPD